MEKLETVLKSFKEAVNGVTNENVLQEWFEKIAKVFLYGGYIKVRNDYKVFIRTVEFYFHSEVKDGVYDPIVYHRNGRDLVEAPYFPFMSLHAHASGFDITFEKEGEYRASALIRSYEVKDKDDYYLKWEKIDNGAQGMFLKRTDYEYNTQSLYLKALLNGFAFGNDNDIKWVDSRIATPKVIMGKPRQNVPLYRKEGERFEKITKKYYDIKKEDFNNQEFKILNINGEEYLQDPRPWQFQREDINHNSMIIDNLTNTVFLSNYLEEECPALYASLTKVLNDNDIDFKILGNTKDYWCRDYMPIQTDANRFVSYNYNPDYLVNNNEIEYITKARNVKNVDFLRKAEKVNLNLTIDGGNVVKCGNKIVMTDKVFVENKDKSPEEVLRLLEKAFRCEVIFLPWDREETYGHSDGIVHYLGDNRVLLTNYEDFDKAFAQEYRLILEKYFEVITLKYNVKEPNENSWAYINFLQVGSLVLVPQLGIPEDEQALQQIQAALPQCKVEGVPALEAVRNGGALNCVSWNVRI